MLGARLHASAATAPVTLEQLLAGLLIALAHVERDRLFEIPPPPRRRGRLEKQGGGLPGNAPRESSRGSSGSGQRARSRWLAPPLRRRHARGDRGREEGRVLPRGHEAPGAARHYVLRPRLPDRLLPRPRGVHEEALGLRHEKSSSEALSSPRPVTSSRPRSSPRYVRHVPPSVSIPLRSAASAGESARG